MSQGDPGPQAPDLWKRRSDRGPAQEVGGVAAAAGEFERSLELRLNTQGTFHQFFLVQSMC